MEKIKVNRLCASDTLVSIDKQKCEVYHVQYLKEVIEDDSKRIEVYDYGFAFGKKDPFIISNDQMRTLIDIMKEYVLPQKEEKER